MTKAVSFVRGLTFTLACGVSHPALGLEVRAIPQRVHPRSGARQWSGTVQVVIPRSAASVAIHLGADSPAVLATPYLEVPAGASSATVEITASQRGDARVWAWGEDSGAKVETTVSFDRPPAQLRVRAEPPRTLAIGSAGATRLIVDLLDEEGHLTTSDSPIVIAVVLPVGRLEGDLVIEPGRFSDEARVTSLLPGSGRVQVETPKLAGDTCDVEFAFPWAMLAVAMAGGGLGAAYQSGRRSARAWLLGALPGLPFALAAYGLVAFLPAQALGALRPLAALPITTALGTAVLGLAAGYGGRRFFPAGTASPSAPPNSPGAPAPGLVRS